MTAPRAADGRADVIAGDKGTGKTALYKILRKRYTSLPELSHVEVVAAFNPTGNPVFQRLAQQQLLSEAQYTTVWKAYILSLIGNWLLELYDQAPTDKMRELDDLLNGFGHRTNGKRSGCLINGSCRFGKKRGYGIDRSVQ